VDENTIGIMVEPVQGEGGVYPATAEFMTGIRRLCDDKGLLLLLDEIQTGWCRTGSVMSYMNYGIKPDIVSMAKAMGGGMPIGAICASEEAAKAFTPGSHGTTYGGNPVCCAASLAQIGELLEHDLAGNARKMGDYLMKRLCEVPHVREVRGQGLLIGIEFDGTVKAPDIKHQCMERRVLVTAIGNDVIRLLPPLILEREHCDRAVEIITASVAALAGQ
jgi:acetylornithine/N-succinyldiaminopimelate aminotransferase